jgi:parallel beta-helix repeat protein
VIRRHAGGELAILLISGFLLVAATPTSTPAPTSAPTPTPVCGSLQALVDAAPTGSVVTAPACTYRETVTIGKPLTLRGYGATISGKDAAGTTIRSAWVVVNASDVTVEGFTMRDANNAAQTGAVRVQAGISRFTLRDCDLAYAAGADVSIGVANDSLIENCAIHAAGQLGVHVGGDGTNGRDNVVRNNRIYANNTAGFDPEWEAGGLKATRQTGLRLESNDVYDNAGPGLWCDIYCQNIVVTGNRIYRNTYAGIFFEVSTGASIRSNRLWGNGWGKATWGWGAGILISSSGGADVSDNIVAWNYAGISVISQNRQDWNHSETNNYVHGNTIIGEYDHWLAFWAQDWSGSLFDAASNNRGSGNRYWMNHAEDSHWRFEWQGGKSTLATFNATPGDEQGTYLSDAEKTSVLANAGIPTAPGPIQSPTPGISLTMVTVATVTMVGVVAGGWWAARRFRVRGHSA